MTGGPGDLVVHTTWYTDPYCSSPSSGTYGFYAYQSAHRTTWTTAWSFTQVYNCFGMYRVGLRVKVGNHGWSNLKERTIYRGM